MPFIMTMSNDLYGKFRAFSIKFFWELDVMSKNCINFTMQLWILRSFQSGTTLLVISFLFLLQIWSCLNSLKKVRLLFSWEDVALLESYYGLVERANLQYKWDFSHKFRHQCKFLKIIGVYVENVNISNTWSGECDPSFIR